MTKIEQIKKLLFGDEPAPIPAPITEPVSMAKEYTLLDGTVVSIDKLEVGGAVTIAGIPAPEGTHKVADGSEIMTDVNGIITAIKLPQEPGVPEIEAKAAPVDYSKQFAELQATVQSLKDKFENDLNVATGKLAKQESILKEIFSVVEAMSVLPVSTPVEVPNGKFSKQAATEDRLRQLQENLIKIKIK